ncbi:Pseudouridine-5'-phosphatase [Halocaridina rubra]|uniref:Pseudouridine-5'-phosphatase n=1 Tax=Halocaridina rubra TaxID=373956 RepID=A0AAN9AGZ2_HALRR
MMSLEWCSGHHNLIGSTCYSSCYLAKQPLKEATADPGLSCRALRECMLCWLYTERLYTEATQALCTPYGKQYTWEIKVQCMGMKGPTAAQHIINSLGLPMTVEEYLKRIADQYNALFPTAKKLADTENRYMEATQAVCSEFDKEYTWEFKYQLMGMKGQLVGQRIIDTLGLPLTLAEYQTKTSRHHKRLFPESKILPGIVL